MGDGIYEGHEAAERNRLFEIGLFVTLEKFFSDRGVDEHAEIIELLQRWKVPYDELYVPDELTAEAHERAESLAWNDLNNNDWDNPDKESAWTHLFYDLMKTGILTRRPKLRDEIMNNNPLMLDAIIAFGTVVHGKKLSFQFDHYNLSCLWLIHIEDEVMEKAVPGQIFMIHIGDSGWGMNFFTPNARE